MKTAIPVSEKLMLTPEETAGMLSLCVKSLNKLPIPRYKLLTKVLYKREDVEDYVRQMVVSSDA